MSVTEEIRCNHCKKALSDVLKCSRCLCVTYCSSDCQKIDWSKHKVFCQKDIIELANASLKVIEKIFVEPTFIGFLSALAHRWLKYTSSENVILCNMTGNAQQFECKLVPSSLSPQDCVLGKYIVIASYVFEPKDGLGYRRIYKLEPEDCAKLSNELYYDFVKKINKNTIVTAPFTLVCNKYVMGKIEFSRK